VNASFKTILEKVKPVAQLEGWDVSRLDMLITQYESATPDSQEALHLMYGDLKDLAPRYLKIRALRTEDFWTACKISNSVEFREYRDLRQLANKIEGICYGKRKKAKKSKTEEHSESPGV
jgi:hypothetical protein